MSKLIKIICWIYWASLVAIVLPVLFFDIDRMLGRLLFPQKFPGEPAIDPVDIMSYVWSIFIAIFLLDTILLTIIGTINWWYKPRSYFVVVTTILNYLAIIFYGLLFLLAFGVINLSR